ncbi:MAG TPA: glycosyltransferase family 39 protein [Solirubrobacterales bacterium]|nr:glycosyltransferase family 39 protein [Solirubrobacterales bacterium]
MEVASLPRRGGRSLVQSLREAALARSRAFWIVAGVTVLGAALRFATLGLQSYHHDEVVTATRVLPSSFSHAMEAVGSSESAPPLYYALAWVWTQVFGTDPWGLRSLSALAGVATIPIAYLIGRELRDRRAGLLAAALVAVNPMLLWYSQEARAYALLAFLCALSLCYCVRALREDSGNDERSRRDLVLWGVFSALALATHYFAVFPLAAEAVLLLRRRGRATLRGLWIIGLVALLLAPLVSHQMSYGHAEWIGVFSLGHRVWETAATFVTGETGDIIGGPERPVLAFLPLALVLAAFGLLALRGGREEKRAAAVPLAVGAFTLGIPLLLAIVSTSKDYVLARNLLPALVPLLIVIAIALTVRRARRLGAAIAALLVAYSLGFCLWVDFDEDLQRPDWQVVADRLGEPEAPRATVLWVLGEAPLRYYLSPSAIQVKASESYDWLVHEVNFVSDGSAPPPPSHLLGPGFREVAHEDTGRLFIRRYRFAGPELAPLRLRLLRYAPLHWRNNGVLLDGVGPQ